MDPRIYRYAMSGDTNSMRKLVKEDQLDLTHQLTLHSNNALHIAAQHGHRAFAEELIRLSPSLLFRSNFDGDLPLHVAAREGHMDLVDILIDSLKNISNPDDEVADLESTDSSMAQAVWLKINLKGNTALHEAMRFRHTKVAMALLGFDPRLADGLNHAGESPLYLGCELRVMVVVERILSCGSFRVEGLNGRTPLHASAISGHYVSVDRIGVGQPVTKKRPRPTQGSRNHAHVVEKIARSHKTSGRVRKERSPLFSIHSSHQDISFARQN
ncbi:hypothetical protein QJS10_CPA09g01304 [Acorus calamus]|uniref:Uncharacterized protein n=1 Tax=Acorus calamus TaxID=4465 RepID=A0AAV9E5C3_ACOCL|nr:hypothetical protein QJS10_CPA09g01304 [Acorus calamus]